MYTHCYAPWYKSVIQLGFSLYGIHNLVPAALGCVYPIEASTSLYNLYTYNTYHFLLTHTPSPHTHSHTHTLSPHPLFTRGMMVGIICSQTTLSDWNNSWPPINNPHHRLTKHPIFPEVGTTHIEMLLIIWSYLTKYESFGPA